MTVSNLCFRLQTRDLSPGGYRTPQLASATATLRQTFRELEKRQLALLEKAGEEKKRRRVFWMNIVEERLRREESEVPFCHPVWLQALSRILAGVVIATDKSCTLQYPTSLAYLDSKWLTGSICKRLLPHVDLAAVQWTSPYSRGWHATYFEIAW